MSKIRLLSPDVYNKIAAGEVIENPVGVVKELVENSIDAGATNIVIEVTDGGFATISVTDNGCGIQHEDIPNAFVEHATSKVDTLDDLYYLQTLGFRGEALASIA
ncbi:MAG: ATP-binding protein, partial [Clostridia bacterium]|nr:ATP-binding protein [Clostridia bacterium]